MVASRLLTRLDFHTYPRYGVALAKIAVRLMLPLRPTSVMPLQRDVADTHGCIQRLLHAPSTLPQESSPQTRSLLSLHWELN